MALPGTLIWGPLLEQAAEADTLLIRAQLCELRPAFLPKGQMGRHFRAVSRNGRVLLATPWPLELLAGRVAQVRIAPWHTRVFPGDPLSVRGLLLTARPAEIAVHPLRCVVSAQAEAAGVLHLDLGGRRVLTFQP